MLVITRPGHGEKPLQALRPGGLQICVAVELDELLGGKLHGMSCLECGKKQGKMAIEIVDVPMKN